MQRVLVMGSSGSGKSTFARRLSAMTGIPTVSIDALNQVAANDWKKFLLDRVNYVGPNAPLAGLEGSGWKLVYTDTPSDLQRTRDAIEQDGDFRFSLGLLLGRTGRVGDSIFFMPAQQASRRSMTSGKR